MNDPEPSDSSGELNDPAAETPETPDGEPKGKQGRKAGVLFIWLTLFIDILGIGIVIPVLPGVVQEILGANESVAALYYGVIVASYATMQFLFAPIIGALSDRFGRRPVLLASLFGLGIDFIIQGLAHTIELLFVARLLSGIMGGSITTGNAYIADVSDDDNRARNFGLVGAAFGLGFIIGPALGGLLSGVWLRLPFFAAAALALVNWLYGYFVLPESLPPEKRKPFSLRNANPLGSVKALRRYPFVAGLAVVFLLKAFAQRGLENVWVLYTKAKFDWNEMANGYFLAWVGLTATIVLGGLVRPTVNRFGERRVLLVATLISTVSFLGYGLADQGWILPVIATFGALGGLASPAIQSLVTSTVDDSEQGTIQGALTSLQGLTSIAAPLVFTTGLFRYFTRAEAPVRFPGAPFLLGALLIFVAFFVALAVFKRYPPEIEEDAPKRQPEQEQDVPAETH
ncbi:TCR/Tet family MFS transporter [Roseiconus nitratireducens]|uniref:TCR/Tet family MFS transporter n=1 Tax=Roseiconus nitratireducens TaxID=2605748 RepID=A0A5M6D4B6_9BACT|nr:TCR/Tet family MFS transporter [Roseiconus nitratireducens]KAA5542183.1 TCR/Tet family MFS transporter [Roseiconus nitratireducens]